MGAATRASARGYNVPQTRPKPTPQKNLATDHYSRDFHECNAPIRVKKLDREGSPFGESLRRQTSLIRRQTSLIRRQINRKRETTAPPGLRPGRRVASRLRFTIIYPRQISPRHNLMATVTASASSTACQWQRVCSRQWQPESTPR